MQLSIKGNRKENLLKYIKNVPTAGGILGPQVETAVGITLKSRSSLCPMVPIHPDLIIMSKNVFHHLVTDFISKKNICLIIMKGSVYAKRLDIRGEILNSFYQTEHSG